MHQVEQMYKEMRWSSEMYRKKMSSFKRVKMEKWRPRRGLTWMSPVFCVILTLNWLLLPPCMVLVSPPAAKAGVTGKQENFYREQLNKHLYRATVHRKPWRCDIEGSASGVPDISDTRHVKLIRRILIFQVDILMFHMWGGCLDFRSRIIGLRSRYCRLFVARPPVTACGPGGSFLTLRDGHLLASRRGVSIGHRRVRVSLLRRRSVVRIGHEKLRH